MCVELDDVTVASQGKTGDSFSSLPVHTGQKRKTRPTVLSSKLTYTLLYLAKDKFSTICVTYLKRFFTFGIKLRNVCSGSHNVANCLAVLYYSWINEHQQSSIYTTEKEYRIYIPPSFNLQFLNVLMVVDSSYGPKVPIPGQLPSAVF